MSFNEFDEWDPMMEDYSDPNFNSYGAPVYQNYARPYSGARTRPPRSEIFPSTSLFVRNIPYNMKEEAFVNIFTKYGPVKNHYIKFRPNQRYTYGFVHYYDFNDAQEALLDLSEQHAYGFFIEFATKSINDRAEMPVVANGSYVDDSCNGNLSPLPSAMKTPAKSFLRGSRSGMGRGLPVNENQPNLSELKVICNNSGREVSVNPELSSCQLSPHSHESTSYNHVDLPDSHSRCMSSNSCVVPHSPYVIVNHPSHCNDGKLSNCSKDSSFRSQCLSCLPEKHCDCSKCNSVRESCSSDCLKCNFIHESCTACKSNCLHGTLPQRHSFDHSSVHSSNSLLQACAHKKHSQIDDTSPLPNLELYTIPCSFCKKPGSFVCSICKQPYCTRDCQLNDWSQHKVVCRPGLQRKHEQKDASSTVELMDIMPIRDDSEKYASEKPVKLKTYTENSVESTKKQQTEDTRSFDKHLSHPRNKLSENCYPLKKTENIQDKRSVNRPATQGRWSKESVGIKNVDVQQNQTKISVEPTGEQKQAPKTAKFNSISKNTPSENSQEKAPKTAKFSSISKNTLSENSQEKVQVCFVLSPEEFWVQKYSDIKILKEITKSLELLLQNKLPLDVPAVDDLCAALFEDGQLYRGTIKKINSNGTYEVYYIDYGNTSTVKNCDLYQLPEKLTSYSAQAICCKLADIKPPRNSRTWKEDDVAFFAHLCSKCALKSVVVKKHDKYEVDLVREEDGLSVSHILGNEKSAEWMASERSNKAVELNDPDKKACENSKKSTEFIKKEKNEEQKGNVKNSNKNEKLKDQDSLDFEVPTVFSKLKAGMSVCVSPMHKEEDDTTGFWGWICDENLIEKIESMQLLLELKHSEAKDISLTVEEGDAVTVHSSAFNAWYRAVILKRNKNAFKVRYIDYGNEEEVAQVYSISDEHLNIISPLLYFKSSSPSSSSRLPQMLNQKLIDSVVIKSISKYEACFEFSSENIILNGFPWFYGLSPSCADTEETKNLVTEKPSCEKNVKSVTHCSPVKKSVTPEKNTLKSPATANFIPSSVRKKEASSEREKLVSPADIAKTIMTERDLPVSKKVQISIPWCESVNDLYVQKVADSESLNNLVKSMTAHYNLQKKKDYIPAVGEVVSAKFSADGCWYRGQIIKAENNEYTVFFIDFGNTEKISQVDIQFLDKKFHSPMFSVCVSLCDIKPDQFNSELLEKLLTNVWDLEVVNSKTKPKKVKLYKDSKSLLNILCDNPETECVNKSKPSVSKDINVPKKTEVKFRPIDFEKAEATVVHCEVKRQIFIRLLNDENAFLKMQVDLNNTCQDVGSDYTPSIDDVVCALFEEFWYRGFIVDVKEGDKCIVNFIDYGNIEIIDNVNIKPLHREFISFPIFAINISLANVSSDLLTEELYDKLRNISCIVKVVDENSNPIKVKMFNSQGLCFNDALCGESNGNQNASVKETSDSQDRTENCVKHSDTVPVSANNIKSALNAADDLANFVSTNNAVNTPCESSVVRKRKESTDVCYSIDDWTYVSFPEGDCTVIVFKFYSHDLLFCAPYVEENVKLHVDLLAEITAYCNGLSSTEYSPSTELEAVFARSDGDWYRGLVTKLDPPNYEIQLVDYGDELTLTASSLRKMTKQYLSAPVQVHLCRLDGFTYDEADKEKITEILKPEMPEYQTFDAKVSKQENGFVALNIPLITELLVNEGLAKNVKF